jgi:HPt (histidine-containing phosphotransfer) domain-containing protein
VPIIALTAHTMCGEREKCIAAGCVEYISKPVAPRTLVDVVGRVAKKKVVDFRGPNSNSESCLPGTLVAYFLEKLPIRVAQLHQAQERQNWPEVARLAHQMAGAAGGYGFPEIGRIAAEIECHAVHDQSPSVLEQAMRVFDSLCNRAINDSKSAPC